MLMEDANPSMVYKNAREGFAFSVAQPQTWGFKEIKGEAQMTAKEAGIDIVWQVEGTPISKIIAGLFKQSNRAESVDEAKTQIEETVSEFVNRKAVKDYLRLTSEIEKDAPRKR